MRKQCFPPKERFEFPFLLGGDELSTTPVRASAGRWCSGTGMLGLLRGLLLTAALPWGCRVRPPSSKEKLAAVKVTLPPWGPGAPTATRCKSHRARREKCSGEAAPHAASPGAGSGFTTCSERRQTLFPQGAALAILCCHCCGTLLHLHRDPTLLEGFSCEPS